MESAANAQGSTKDQCDLAGLMRNLHEELLAKPTSYVSMNAFKRLRCASSVPPKDSVWKQMLETNAIMDCGVDGWQYRDRNYPTVNTAVSLQEASRLPEEWRTESLLSLSRLASSS